VKVHHFALLDQLRQHGYRLTHQRSIILEALSDLDGHASAEEIYAQVCQHCAGIDLSTVYRTLETLCELRLLSCADLGQGHVQFEIVTSQPHHHLVCRSCGTVTVLDHSYLAGVAEAIRRDLGFDPIFDHFAIFGLCAACRETEKGPTADKV
jgi:Fur family ferric uptake transcriptional regulator